MTDTTPEATAPEPDDHGRYRVINEVGHEYSTRSFNPDAHKIAEGSASDVGGTALPPKYREVLSDQAATDPTPESAPVSGPPARRRPPEATPDPATT